MLVSILVAMSENHAIGRDGRLPWRLSSDMRRFKALTMGRHVILGRRTFESIGRPLAGRQIIVLSRREGYSIEGVDVARSLERALVIAESRGEQEAIIAGGAQVYSQALPLADRMYMTLVHAHLEADTFFPTFGENDWVEIWSEVHPAGPGDEYPFTFIHLDRVQKA